MCLSLESECCRPNRVIGSSGDRVIQKNQPNISNQVAPLITLVFRSPDDPIARSPDERYSLSRKFLSPYNLGLSLSHPCASLENNSRPSVPTQSAPFVLARTMSVSGGAMKETMPAVPVERHFEQEGFGNRKLIRPFINHTSHPAPNHAPG